MQRDEPIETKFRDISSRFGSEMRGGGAIDYFDVALRTRDQHGIGETVDGQLRRPLGAKQALVVDLAIVAQATRPSR